MTREEINAFQTETVEDELSVTLHCSNKWNRSRSQVKQRSANYLNERESKVEKLKRLFYCSIDAKHFLKLDESDRWRDVVRADRANVIDT